eukprot:6212051-Pleurochrysis_carterae.AAC.2
MSSSQQTGCMPTRDHAKVTQPHVRAQSKFILYAQGSAEVLAMAIDTGQAISECPESRVRPSTSINLTK